MPRPRNCVLHQFYEENINNQIMCNNDNCGGKVLHKHSANLERHLKVLHSDLYVQYLQRKSEKSDNSTTDSSRIIINVNLHNEIKKESIKRAVVELFTKNERPLEMIEDRAFKVLVQPVFDVLKIQVNSNNINEIIIASAKRMKSEISNELKGKLLSLNIDVVTRQDLKVLGINVQYIRNSTIVIKTLAIKVLKPTYTSKYLMYVILNVLKIYSIHLNQILTITTHNGAKILKAITYLNTELETISNEQNGISIKNEGLTNSLLDFESSICITSIRCGSNFFQSCVYEVLNNNLVKEKIEIFRSVAKHLKTEYFINIFKNCHYNMPIVDNEKCWKSTFNMIERLMELRITIESLSVAHLELFINTDVWSFAEKFVQLFKSLYTATAKLQNEQLIFSDLYILIMNILFEIQSMPSTDLKILLIEAINKRKNNLFDNELLNAAVYFDPRIKLCLSLEQISKAKNIIKSLHKRIISLTGKSNKVYIFKLFLAESHFFFFRIK